MKTDQTIIHDLFAESYRTDNDSFKSRLAAAVSGALDEAADSCCHSIEIPQKLIEVAIERIEAELEAADEAGADIAADHLKTALDDLNKAFASIKILNVF